MNLGRYLLAAVIIGFFTREALVWAGAWSPYSTQSFAQSEEAPALTREAVVLVVQTLESQPGSIAITLVMAGLLSLLLRRLFRAELSGWGKALALGSFLAGHITILGAAMRLIYAPLTLALTGRPAELSLSLSLGLGAVYAGIVTYGCFGSGWWSAVKGLFGLGWATAEIASLSCLGTVACASKRPGRARPTTPCRRRAFRRSAPRWPGLPWHFRSRCCCTLPPRPTIGWGRRIASLLWRREQSERHVLKPGRPMGAQLHLAVGWTVA